MSDFTLDYREFKLTMTHYINENQKERTKN